MDYADALPRRRTPMYYPKPSERAPDGTLSMRAWRNKGELVREVTACGNAIPPFAHSIIMDEDWEILPEPKTCHIWSYRVEELLGGKGEINTLYSALKSYGFDLAPDQAVADLLIDSTPSVPGLVLTRLFSVETRLVLMGIGSFFPCGPAIYTRSFARESCMLRGDQRVYVCRML